MPQKLKIEVRGGKELAAKLRQLGPKLANQAGDDALIEGAKPIVTEAKARVPVRTGKLRDSITAVPAQAPDQHRRRVLIGFTEPTARRAHLTEFGTSRSAAKPFMRPAMDARAEDAVKAIGERLGEALEKQGERD